MGLIHNLMRCLCKKVEGYLLPFLSFYITKRRIL
nr:MAG TPA: hypothetical protein [Caudoviricetes sp.]DAT42814.1 MAG TPA: hypothetical protein [Caudoviricetes sp.]